MRTQGRVSLLPYLMRPVLLHTSKIPRPRRPTAKPARRLQYPVPSIPLSTTPTYLNCLTPLQHAQLSPRKPIHLVNWTPFFKIVLFGRHVRRTSLPSRPCVTQSNPVYPSSTPRLLNFPTHCRMTGTTTISARQLPANFSHAF